MHRIFRTVARVMALLGGVVLLGLIIITVVSIVGRMGATLAHNDFAAANLSFVTEALKSWDIGPVSGDFELVEMGVAFAIFAFLPWCQLTAGHATVDLFTSALPMRANRFLIFFWEAVMALAIVVICWRLGLGLSDKIRNGETTFLLQLPVWYGFAASFAASVTAAAVAVYVALMRFAEFRTNNDLLPRGGEAGGEAAG